MTGNRISGAAIKLRRVQVSPPETLNSGPAAGAEGGHHLAALAALVPALRYRAAAALADRVVAPSPAEILAAKKFSTLNYRIR